MRRVAVAGGDADQVVIEIVEPAVPRSNGSRSTSRMRLGDLLRAALDEHDELVAAEAADRVGLAQHVGDPRRDVAQQLVADRVAERVVDALEAVEVDEHRRRVDAPRGAAWTSICSARSMISARFGSPVSASCSAWWRSWPVFSSTIRSARARPRASTCTSRNASRPSDEPDRRSTSAACTSGSTRARRGAALATETVQRPSASTEKRCAQAVAARDGAEAGDRRLGERVRQRAEGGAGAGGDAVVGHRGVLALERHRDAGLRRRPTERRIGSASKRPTIQPVDVAPARRSASWGTPPPR